MAQIDGASGASGESAPGPPGHWQAAQEAAEKQREIYTHIASQVQRQLAEARGDTERGVKVELGEIREKVKFLDDSLNAALTMLDKIDAEQGEQDISSDEVHMALSKVEEEWTQEIKTLKGELHETILAHNHNADLIKHHKETIDQLKQRAEAMRGDGRGLVPSDLKETLVKLQLMQARPDPFPDEKLQAMLERVLQLESQVSNLAAIRGPGVGPAGGPGSWPGYGAAAAAGLPPGPNYALLQQHMRLMAGAAAAGSAPGMGGGASAAAAVAALAAAGYKGAGKKGQDAQQQALLARALLVQQQQQQQQQHRSQAQAAAAARQLGLSQLQARYGAYGADLSGLGMGLE